MTAAAPPIEELLAQGESLVHARRFGEAEACANAVLARQPRNARGHYILALCALFQQRPQAAAESLERALKQERTNAQYHFVLGMALAALGRHGDAVVSYRRALQFRPQFFEALANMGSALEAARRFEEARDAYRRALALRQEALLYNGLGLCELALGELPAAGVAFERALALKPDFTTALNNWATVLGKTGERERAVEMLRRATHLRPDFLEAWVNLGEQLYMGRDDAGAIAAFDRVLALDPANDEIRYLRDSIAGVNVERAPDQFVRNFFDRFAREFDQRLTQDLGYRAPEEMARFLARWLEGRAGLRVVDLGCGTGLSGIFIRPQAARLVGVDLSGEMLARARGRGIYDELVQAEIAGFLAAQPPGSVDLALAADVFVYVGRLDEVLRTCAAALAPGGLFAFSVEDLPGEGGEGFRLARTGRYAHARDYVQAAGSRAGLALRDSEAVVLRHDDGKPVAGRFYAFGKD